MHTYIHTYIHIHILDVRCMLLIPAHIYGVLTSPWAEGKGGQETKLRVDFSCLRDLQGL